MKEWFLVERRRFVFDAEWLTVAMCTGSYDANKLAAEWWERDRMYDVRVTHATIGDDGTAEVVE
jgi:hypothetical protein